MSKRSEQLYDDDSSGSESEAQATAHMNKPQDGKKSNDIHLTTADKANNYYSIAKSITL